MLLLSLKCDYVIWLLGCLVSHFVSFSFFFIHYILVIGQASFPPTFCFSLFQSFNSLISLSLSLFSSLSVQKMFIILYFTILYTVYPPFYNSSSSLVFDCFNICARRLIHSFNSSFISLPFIFIKRSYSVLTLLASHD